MLQNEDEHDFLGYLKLCNSYESADFIDQTLFNTNSLLLYLGHYFLPKRQG